MKMGNQIQKFFKLVAVRAKSDSAFIADYVQVMTYLRGLKLDLSKVDRVNEEVIPLTLTEGSQRHKLVSFISQRINEGVSEFTLSSSDATKVAVSFFIPTRDVETVDIPKGYHNTGVDRNKIGGNTFEKIGGLGRDISAKEYMICRNVVKDSPFKVGDVLELTEFNELRNPSCKSLAVRRNGSLRVSLPSEDSHLFAMPSPPVLTNEEFAPVLGVLRKDPSKEDFRANSSQINLTGKARDESILGYKHQNMQVEGVDFKASGRPYCMAQSERETIDFSREPNTQIVFSSGKAWVKSDATMVAAKNAFEKISTISAVGMPTEGEHVKFPNYMNFQESPNGEITYGLAALGTSASKIQDALGITVVELKSKGDVLALVELTLEGGKKIQLYHFFGWPDKQAFPVESLTDQDNALLAQRYSAYETAHAKKSKELDGAYLTHCSAGIGRTGTDAVMSDLLRQMEAKTEKADVLAVLSPENVLKTRKALSESSGRFLVQNDAQLRSSAELAAKLYLCRHPSKDVGYLDVLDVDGLSVDPVAVGMLGKKGLPVAVGLLELDDLSPKWNLTEAGMVNLRAMCEGGASEDVALRTLDKLVNDFERGESVGINGSLNLLAFVASLKAGFGVDSKTLFVDYVRDQLNNFEIPEHEIQAFEQFDAQVFKARRDTIKEKNARRESESSAEDGPPSPFVSGGQQAPPVLVIRQAPPAPPAPPSSGSTISLEFKPKYSDVSKGMGADVGDKFVLLKGLILQLSALDQAAKKKLIGQQQGQVQVILNQFSDEVLGRKGADFLGAVEARWKAVHLQQKVGVKGSSSTSAPVTDAVKFVITDPRVLSEGESKLLAQMKEYLEADTVNQLLANLQYLEMPKNLKTIFREVLESLTNANKNDFVELAKTAILASRAPVVDGGSASKGPSTSVKEALPPLRQQSGRSAVVSSMFPEPPSSSVADVRPVSRPIVQIGEDVGRLWRLFSKMDSSIVAELTQEWVNRTEAWVVDQAQVVLGGQGKVPNVSWKDFFSNNKDTLRDRFLDDNSHLNATALKDVKIQVKSYFCQALRDYLGGTDVN